MNGYSGNAWKVYLLLQNVIIQEILSCIYLFIAKCYLIFSLCKQMTTVHQQNFRSLFICMVNHLNGTVEIHMMALFWQVMDKSLL